MDVVSGTFKVSIGMKVFWYDPRMVDREEVPFELWCPNVMLPTSTDIAESSLMEEAR